MRDSVLLKYGNDSAEGNDKKQFWRFGKTGDVLNYYVKKIRRNINIHHLMHHVSTVKKSSSG